MKAVEDGQKGKEALPAISFDDREIHLKYADGRQVDVAHRDLRLNCMCALCVNEITGRLLIRPPSLLMSRPKKFTRLAITPLALLGTMAIPRESIHTRSKSL